MYRHLALRVVVPALAGAAVCASTAAASQTVVEPSPAEARTFATSRGGWTSSVDYGNLACIPGVTCPTANPQHVPNGGSGGAADGYLRDTFGTLLGVLATSNITWTSPTFVAPTGTDAAELAFNVRPQTASLQAIGTVSITPRLVDVANPADTIVLPSRPITAASASFGRQAFTVPAASIVPGRTYRIQIVVSLTTNVSAVTSGNVDLDDVALTLTDLAGPADLSADVPATGPLRVAGYADANGVDTDVSVEYGPTTAYGSTTPAVRLAGATTGAQPYTIPLSLTGLQAGATYHYRVRAENADGTVTTTDATFVAPVPPSDAAPTVAGGTSSRQRIATFTRAGDVTAAVVELLNTDGSVRDSWADTDADGKATITLPEADGTYDLRLRRTTTRGLESVSATVPVALDRTAPSVSGLDAGVTPAVSNVRGRTLTLTRPSDATTVRAQVIDADDLAVGAPVAVTGGSATVQLGTTDGQYRVRVTVIDAAGNEATATTTAVTLDRVAPAAGVAPTVTGAGNVRRRTVAFTRASDASSAAVEVLDAGGAVIDTVPVASGAEVDVTLPDADGAYAVRVLQTDAAGNDARTPATDLTLDRVAPDAGPAPTVTGAVDARVRTVAFTRDPDASSVAVEVLNVRGDVVDTVPVATGGSADVTLPAADGTYTIRVRQSDAAGNDARTPGTPAVIDATGPEAGPAPTVTGVANGRARTVAFTRAADAATAAVELLDGDGHVVDQVPVPAGDRAELTLPDADGTYAVRVRQTDAVGNVTRTAPTVVLLDRVAPVAGPAPRISVSSDDASEVSVSFVRAADAEDVTVEVLDARRSRRSAVSVPTGDTARITVPREAGRYTIRVVQTDRAGNSTVTAETTIDRATPQPEPQPTPPAEPVRDAAQCRTTTVVTSVAKSGRRIVVRGFTTSRGGTTLAIYDGLARQVGTAVAGADGTFSARVVPDTTVRRGDVRYRAVADGRSSSSVQLNRANALTTVKRTGTTVTLEGRVDLRRIGRARTVVALGGAGACADAAGTLAPIGRAKVDARGRYRLTVRADAAGRLLIRTRVIGTRAAARSVYVVR